MSIGTYKVSDAIAIVGSTAANRGTENLHTAADLALKYLWDEFDWRESIDDLPPFYLVPGVRDYGQPFTAVPEDFLGLKKAWLVHATLDGSGARYEEIAVKKDVLVSDFGGTVWPPSAISYAAETQSFRLSSWTPSSLGAPYWWIAGRYKKEPTKITGANATSTTIPWSDLDFPMFVEAVRWKLWQLNGDPRAGGIQVFGTGQRQYSGQAAIVHDLVEQAIAREHDALGPEQIYPETSLTEW